MKTKLLALVCFGTLGAADAAAQGAPPEVTAPTTASGAAVGRHTRSTPSAPGSAAAPGSVPLVAAPAPAPGADRESAADPRRPSPGTPTEGPPARPRSAPPPDLW